MRLVVVGVSHKTAPVELRERLALRSESASALIREAVAAGDLAEGVALSTCNRVEIYGAAPEDPAGIEERLLGRLGSATGAPLEAFAGHFYRKEGGEAIRHLYRVAAGLEALVIGETEILAQVKEAYLLAVQNQTVGSVLNPLFQSAFRTAKEVHTRTEVGRGRVSVGSVAVELASKIFGSLADRRVLVVGAGEMASRMLETIAGAGVRNILLVNRDAAAGEALAEQFSASRLPFTRLEEGLEEADIALSSTAAPHAVITRAMLSRVMEKRRHRPLFLIDIAVPRDVESQARDLADLFLYDIDDLEAVVSVNLRARQEELFSCERIIDAAAGQFDERHLARRFEHLVRSLETQFERVGVAELRDLWRRSPGIPAERRREVEETVRRLMDRIANLPAEAIRQEIANGDGRVLMDALKTLFRL